MSQRLITGELLAADDPDIYKVHLTLQSFRPGHDRRRGRVALQDVGHLPPPRARGADAGAPGPGDGPPPSALGARSRPWQVLRGGRPRPLLPWARSTTRSRARGEAVEPPIGLELSVGWNRWTRGGRPRRAGPSNAGSSRKPAWSYLGARGRTPGTRGRTRGHVVVPGDAWSYPKARGRTLEGL